MIPPIPASWQPVVANEINKPYFQRLAEFLDKERRKHTIYPPEKEIFTALEAAPFEEVKVLILGQDPYHDDNQAHGLAFSVRPGIRPPPSLMNIFKELSNDVGFRIPDNGYLLPWAQQGVLMLNAVLTVRAHQPNSHKDKGWENFTDSIIHALSLRPKPVVFLLWGGYARMKKALVDTKKHAVLEAPHPSPLSAQRGFFGCRHFSKTNRFLQEWGMDNINWQLPDISH